MAGNLFFKIIKLKKMQGVLFDMDGVLVDSEKYICEAAMQMFKEKGLIVNPEDFKPFVGKGENKYIGGVAEKYNFEVDTEEVKARTYELYEHISKDKLNPLPGVYEFIKTCRKKNLSIAVATSADEIKMNINLRAIGLSNSFDATINGLEIEHKKPHPDIYLHAAKLLNAAPSECLVVEDAVSGVKAGKRAGAKVLALLTSFSKEELSDADWICDDLSNAPDAALNW